MSTDSNIRFQLQAIQDGLLKRINGKELENCVHLYGAAVGNKVFSEFQTGHLREHLLSDRARMQSLYGALQDGLKAFRNTDGVAILLPYEEEEGLTDWLAAFELLIVVDSEVRCFQACMYGEEVPGWTFVPNSDCPNLKRLLGILMERNRGMEKQLLNLGFGTIYDWTLNKEDNAV